jgi:hypothetical protein
MANLKLGVTIGGNVAIHSGNYNNYAPTLTGGNASGTWGISISGNSATTSQTNFSALSVNNNAVWHAGNFSPSSYLPLSGGTLTGKVFGPSMDSGAYGGLIEIRERGYVNATQDAWDYSPALTFHWGNRHAKRFGMRADGQFAVDNAPLATQSWVASQGYVTSDSDFQTLGWDEGSFTLTISGGNSVELTGVATQDFVTSQGYITGYSETDTLATVTSRGASTSSNLALNGRVTFASSVTNRPQFPGGMLGLDTGDGNFDIWGISRDYYPSNPTAANAWGLRWNGDNNDFEFVGGGTNRVILDMDSGNVTATGNITSNSAMYAPIYYDSNDSAYYLDPTSTSRLSTLWLRGGTQYDGELYIGGTTAGSALRINYDQIWTPSGNLHLMYSGAGNIDMNYGGGYTFSRTSLRAPIFYDYNDTNYYVDPNSDSRLYIVRPNGITDPGYTRIVNPDGGRYVTQTSVVTGALRIKLPTQGSSMMMTCTVKVYEYSVNKSFTITFGGHRDGANWYNEFCYLDGDNNRGELTVRFGVDGGKDCVYIGETGTQWSYPQVFVTDVQLGYAGYNANWVTGWEVGFVTSFSTVNRTQTAYRKLTPANYNSYAPSLTGSGASGTWGISITGSAGTLDGLDSTDFMRNYGMLNNTDQYVNFRVIRNSNSSSSNDGMYIGYGNSGSGITRIFGGGATTGQLEKHSNYTFEPGSFRAPIFYDSDNTGYYFDGNSTTSLRTLGSWRADSADWDGEFAGKIQYHASSWYLQAEDRWFFRNAGGENVLTASADGNLIINGILTENSSLRYKENVQSIGSVLDSVETLRAVTYNKIGNGQTEFGLIAEEVAEVYPEIVNYDEIGRPDGINYTRLSAILLKAVQELSEKIKKLES